MPHNPDTSLRLPYDLWQSVQITTTYYYYEKRGARPGSITGANTQAFTQFVRVPVSMRRMVV